MLLTDTQTGRAVEKKKDRHWIFEMVNRIVGNGDTGCFIFILFWGKKRGGGGGK